MSKTETLEFQAETRQLLDLMIHSLYTNKEIFLRELISNASDALDKLRYEALTNPELLPEGEELHIRIDSSKEPRRLIISDNGIGMSKAELVENIGTIAHSGTRELLEKLKKTKNDRQQGELIGQFGVGFYSAFMVADNVTILTRRAGESQGWLWKSSGDGKYTLQEAQKSEHGTTITLELKPADPENGIEDYTEFHVISSIVKKYSDFIQYPIKMKREVEEPILDEEGKPTEKREKKIRDEVLNSMKPIWVRKPSEVKEEEYKEFYHHISHDWSEPLKHFNINAEGVLEYKALIFIPSKAPFDLYYATMQVGLRLYAKRVLIMDHCEALLPKYLRFIRGVVDSADLSLNVSRELLQQDRQLAAIKKRVTKKILDELSKMKEKEFDKYLQFWKEFGAVLKEGYNEDIENQEKLVNLFLFESTADKEKPVSLAEVVSRMKPEQEAIYYLTGESREILERSPHIEGLLAKGYEVLLMTDPVDDFLMQYLVEYEGKKFQSADKAEASVEEEESSEEKEKKEQHQKIVDFLKDKLGDKVQDVKLSTRLVSSPACLVRDEAGISAHLEKLLKQHGQNMPASKHILEINPEHPLIQKIEKALAGKSRKKLDKVPELLLGYAHLAEGSELENPAAFNEALIDWMQEAL